MAHPQTVVIVNMTQQRIWEAADYLDRQLVGATQNPFHAYQAKDSLRNLSG
jgi:hypothetical protein